MGALFFKIGEGNLPTISAILTDGAGNVVDLTGATGVSVSVQGSAVQFTGAAAIINASAGSVSYTFASGQTSVPGRYEMQWVATINGAPVTYPVGQPIVFVIEEALPVLSTNAVSYIVETYPAVRAILGDLDPQFQRYQDAAIANVVRTMVRVGKLGSTYALTPDNRGITPAIAVPTDYAILIYSSAKTILMPNAAAYSYRQRAMGESFGAQRDFVFDLECALHDAQNGEVFHTMQSFYGWVNALTGLNIWSLLTDMSTRAPVATVTIGRAGITVNST
jgi:hypothetical protein